MRAPPRPLPPRPLPPRPRGETTSRHPPQPRIRTSASRTEGRRTSEA